MKRIIIIIFIAASLLSQAQNPSGKEILERIDKNMASKSTISTSKMVIHGARQTRTIEAKSLGIGDEKYFTEYLAPAREKGTKMLKLENELWIYSPGSDRIIKISGHMLRQSVMGSDLSYEDMMDNAELLEDYDAGVIGSEFIDERDCWIVELQAKTAEVNYQIRKIWVDKARYIPLKEELYAKSGKLLKKTELSDITKIGNRWYPKKIVFKDMLKKGAGTEFIIDEIEFDKEIDDYVFTKASLK
ncbi:MAG: outer membrane lipoprotein-sorting protein [Bacteroidales bacterium]|jgi:outer membrane lipoprotein-sorting protein|nr:outer membrane lipoprotein-sorting protein [Bacteroidales bacterium]